MAVPAEVDVAGRGRAHQPRPPRAAVGRDLHVVAGDVAVVDGPPADDEATVALLRRKVPDPGERGRGVVEELRPQLLPQLRARAVVAERPHAHAAETRAVDEVVPPAEGDGVVVVDLPPGRHAAVGLRAVLLLVCDPRRLLDGVPFAAVLTGERDDVLVVHAHGRPVLGAAVRRGADRSRDGGPGTPVIGNAKDQLGGRHARREGRHRVGEVVGGAGQRVDRAGRAGAGRSVVVAHDEDRVGAARRRGVGDRVVADRAEGVERELVALVDPVQLAPDRPDQGGELRVVCRGEGFEVEVDAVGAAISDRRRDLLRKGQAMGRRAEQRLLAVQPARVPAEALDRQDDARVVAVRGRDDARHLRAGPAAPADRGRAVTIALLEGSVAVRADAEVGDRRDLAVVEPETARVGLPVGQESEDLAAQAGRTDCRVRRDPGRRCVRAAGRLKRGVCCGNRRGTATRQVDRRRDGEVARPRGRGRDRAGGPDSRWLPALAAHRGTVETARREGAGRRAANGPAVSGFGLEAEGDSSARREVVLEPTDKRFSMPLVGSLGFQGQP